MSEKAPQNYKNHARLDPLYHGFLVPVAAAAVIVAIVNVIQAPGWASFFGVLTAAALAVAAFKVRVYPLKVQDRLIRLEERMRLATLLPEPWRARIGELTEGQLIALRFASDAEIPALVEKTLAGNLKPKEIKQSIVSWRADYFRV